MGQSRTGPVEDGCTLAARAVHYHFHPSLLAGWWLQAVHAVIRWGLQQLLQVSTLTCFVSAIFALKS